ncbi:MAG: translation initiation factor [SAR324 cluster bacterium]|nr:translation initiation factor [SAR324 cluster bacterium]
MEDSNLVYSSDRPSEDLRQKGTLKKEIVEVTPTACLFKLSIEKKGRGGKAVSLIGELPHNPVYFKKLLKELKNYCGTGGSVKEDHLELQGEQLPKIREFLTKKGYPFKG